MELKFGRFMISIGRQQAMTAKDKPDKDERGGTGTSQFMGLLYENEYNTDLQGEKGLQVYDRMRRSDGQVKAGLLACKLPLIVAQWDMQPASKDAIDVEIANTVGEALFDDMSITWDNFLRQALLMFDFGHFPFEKVWELRKGMYAWKKLAPRLPTSIAEWHVSEDDELDFIKQLVNKNNQYKYVDIPADKLLVFTHEMEGSDFRGISLLRAAYKHWYYKNTLYAIDGIAAERHGVGLADFTFPDNATDDQKNFVKEIGQRLHTHERAYVAHPESIKFALMGVQGQLHDIKGSIEHHDIQIVRSILAQFMNLGAGKSEGSYALSSDQSRFFLMALQAQAKNLCNTINRGAIRQMVDYNWQVERYPKLIVSGLNNPDTAQYAQAVSQLAAAGLLTKDNATENELRRILRLPAMSPEAEAKAKAAEDVPEEPEQESGPEKDKAIEVTTQEEQAASDGPTDGMVAVEHSMREARGPETMVAFKEIAGALDTAEQRLVAAVKPIQERQIKTVAAAVAGYMKDGQYDRVTEIDIPFRDKVADAIEKVFQEMVDYGAKQVRDERSRAGKTLKAADLPVKEDRKSLLRVRALAMANILASKLRAAVMYEAVSQARAGQLDQSALAAAMSSLSLGELENMATFSVSEAFNTGRDDQATEYADEIEEVYSSALLDDNTCKFCEGEDGKTWKYGEQPPAPPYAQCEGREHCRCIHVYVYKAEV